MVAGTLAPLAYTGSKCLYSWWTKDGTQKQKSCVVVPKGSGKTTLCRSLEAVDKDTLIIDLDECVNAQISGQEKQKMEKDVG